MVWGPGIRDTWEPKATLEGETRVVAGVFAETWLGKMTDAAGHIGLDFAAYKGRRGSCPGRRPHLHVVAVQRRLVGAGCPTPAVGCGDA